jgi:hypothetical protein
MHTTKMEDLVSSLRVLADFFEKNAEDLPDGLLDPNFKLSIYLAGKDELLQAKKVMTKGTTISSPLKKNQNSFSYDLTRQFGKYGELEMWTGRDAVCEKVQVGTKTEAVVKTVETGETKEVPIYEWKCDESLAAS